MVEIPLTQGKIAVVDDLDAHLLSYSWYARKHRNTFYAVRELYGNGKPIKKQLVYLHHCVAGHPINRIQIDHVNGDGLDNQRENLRLVTNRENCSNRHYHRNSGKLVGTTFDKKAGKWESKIWINGKKRWIGYFESAKKASDAYQEVLKSIGNQQFGLIFKGKPNAEFARA